MTKEDIDRVLFALRWTCESSVPCRRLDGTYYVDSCFAYDCKKRNYKCDGNCKKVRQFIEILKQPNIEVPFTEMYNNNLSK